MPVKRSVSRHPVVVDGDVIEGRALSTKAPSANGGRIVDPSQDLASIRDLLLVNGAVFSLVENAGPAVDAREIDATGMDQIEFHKQLTSITNTNGQDIVPAEEVSQRPAGFFIVYERSSPTFSRA